MDTARTRSDLPAPRLDASSGTVLDPTPGSLADRLGTRWRDRSPVWVGSGIAFLGIAVMTVLIVAIGFLLTKVLLKGGVGSWDDGVNRWFVEQRTPSLDTLTALGSDLGATLTIVSIALLVSVVLGITHHWRQVEMVIVALTIEVSTFLLATLLVNRARPDVHRLDVSPPTSSYPSGHTAAAITLYVGLAIVVSSLTRNRMLRALAWILAFIVPVIVGLSRLYRGMHHPTDVLASVLLAAGALMFALLAARTSAAMMEQRSSDRVAR
ncbi:MAG: phosphatase PAP2 family protein [Actinomycetota bacterium]